MSKIFDAYRMKVADSTTHDPVREVARTGSVDLYPAPSLRQQKDFAELAQRTLGLKGAQRGAVIAVGSSTSGEGASFVSYSLARTLAEVYAQKVLWIDANFLSPQTELGGPDHLDLVTLLQEPERAAALVVQGNPALITVGTDLNEARRLVAGGGFGQVLEKLAARFGFVIVDLPPVLDSADSALMAAAGDGMLLVIEQKYLKWEILDHGLDLLRSKGVNVLGSVINRREFALPKLIYDRL